ncbi:DNA polymerase delta subunit 1 [Vigna unguiculata]|uniref:DNA polymerase delta subunit 1 n=1 Tax=Vigna unguiculata TaxID=3917 RepID=A0A4D6LWQ1_VIGUN|nr:DNA polymerase delta subunit 1 [Vigna unguiculata]
MSNNALRKRATSMVATQNLLLQPTITSAAEASLNALGRGLRGRRRFFQQLEIDYVIWESHREFFPNMSGPAAIIRIFGATKEVLPEHVWTKEKPE